MGQGFDKELFSSLLATKWLGRKLCYEQEVDSTNVRAKTLAGQGAESGTLCMAEVQTAGRGRRGRSWQTDAGESVAMSFLYFPSLAPEQASMIAPAVGYGTAAGLRSLGLDARVKWPNDVIAGKKKLCGILAEMQADVSGIRYVVVGIGINVNQRTIPAELSDRATSLLLETGRTWRREEVTAAVLGQIETALEALEAAGSLEPFREDYERLLVNCGRQVRIEGVQNSFVGKALGICKTGELLVERTDGSVEAVGAGEVSVRGLYGYV